MSKEPHAAFGAAAPRHRSSVNLSIPAPSFALQPRLLAGSPALARCAAARPLQQRNTARAPAGNPPSPASQRVEPVVPALPGLLACVSAEHSRYFTAFIRCAMAAPCGDPTWSAGEGKMRGALSRGCASEDAYRVML